jgi:hypothetical protein
LHAPDKLAVGLDLLDKMMRRTWSERSWPDLCSEIKKRLLISLEVRHVEH